MPVLVNYHMDTLSGIGYRSEHIHGGYPCTLVDMYTEREGFICTLSRVYAWCGDYLSICRCTIFDDFYMND